MTAPPARPEGKDAPDDYLVHLSHAQVMALLIQGGERLTAGEVRGAEAEALCAALVRLQDVLRRRKLARDDEWGGLAYGS